MKVKFHQTPKRCKSIFKRQFLFIVLCLSLNISINAQSKRTYEKEITVTKGLLIETNVTTDLIANCRGTLTNDNTLDRFIMRGKNGDQRLNIHKVLNIHTWDKQVVKQEVVIDADLGGDNEAAKSFLNSLKIEFDDRANGSLKLDANMNIDKFEMENGFLKADECMITLANGKKHEIQRLEIQTTLYIPKDANLSITGKRHCTIVLDDLEGDLELILSYAEVYGKTVNRIKGNLNYCYNAIFDKVNFAEFNAINSHVKIKEVNNLEIGKQKISNRCLAPSMQKYTKSNSFQNIFNIGKVSDLRIYESANDEINIEQAYIMNVLESAFCQFQIDELNDVCNISSKNSEIKVLKVKKGFNKINMTNTLGEIYLDIEDGANYKLRMPADNYLECELGDKFKKVDGQNANEENYKVGEGENSGSVYINCDKCKFNII